MGGQRRPVTIAARRQHIIENKKAEARVSGVDVGTLKTFCVVLMVTPSYYTYDDASGVPCGARDDFIIVKLS